MKVLGFRGNPRAPRYAVVSECNGTFTLENASRDSDNKLRVPPAVASGTDADLLKWIYNEVIEIFNAHSGIGKVIVKQNEFTRHDTIPKRRSAYIDAAVMLACAHTGIPVEIKVYASMATKGENTKQFAESRVGKTDLYWDTKMADAVNAAWCGLR